MTKLTEKEATQKINDLMEQVNELLTQIGSIADEHGITVYTSNKHFYGEHSRSPIPKVASYDEYGDPLDENGETVWQSSYDGYWVTSSEMC